MEKESTTKYINQTKDTIRHFFYMNLKQAGLRNIDQSHCDILMTLIKKHSLSMGDLANHLARDKSTITVLTNKLVHLGYITKKQCPEDGRRFILKLTKKTLSLTPIFNKIYDEFYSRLFKGIDEQSSQTFLKVLGQIGENFKGNR